MKIRAIGTAVVAGLVALTLTGCVEIGVDVKINGDGTASAVVEYVVADEVIEQTGMSREEFISTAKSAQAEDQPAGTTTEVFETDGGVGVRGTTKGTYRDSGDFSGGSGTPTISDDGSIATFTFPMNTLVESYAAGQTVDAATLDEAFDSLEVSVEFPGEVESASHGASISGNKVTWSKQNVIDSILAGEPLTAKGSIKGGGSGALFLIIGVVVLLVVGGGGAFLYFKKKKESQGNGAYPQQGGYNPNFQQPQFGQQPQQGGYNQQPQAPQQQYGQQPQQFGGYPQQPQAPVAPQNPQFGGQPGFNPQPQQGGYPQQAPQQPNFGQQQGGYPQQPQAPQFGQAPQGQPPFGQQPPQQGGYPQQPQAPQQNPQAPQFGQLPQPPFGQGNPPQRPGGLPPLPPRV